MTEVNIWSMEQTIVSPKIVNEEARILRQCKGRRLSISHSVFRIQNSNNGYYVKSESAKDRYYFVEYKPDSSFCTCWDFASNRSDMCKHLYAVQYAIHLGLVQQIDHKLPISPKKSVADQYKNLSIRDLNELEKAEIEEAEAYRNQRRSWELDEYDY